MGGVEQLKTLVSVEGSRVSRGFQVAESGDHRSGSVASPMPQGGEAVVDVLDAKDMLRGVRLPRKWGDAYAGEGLPGYASFFTKDAGLPDLRLRAARSGALPAGALFATSVVETCDPCTLRAFMTTEEWDVVSVVTDPVRFREAVLKPDVVRLLEGHSCKLPRLPEHLVRDLWQKGYLRALRPGEVSPCPCSIFAVIKSDGESLRLIWNGVKFNELCNPPPPFSITPPWEMLQRLLQQGVDCLLAFDFTTWFVQIRCHAEVAAWFATRLKEGIVCIRGVPMGWAWACVIAHLLTVAFTRAVLSQLGTDASHVVVVEWCIDNTIMGLSRGVDPLRVRECVELVARRHDISLKQSAFEVGRSVDWLMYTLDLDTRVARLKDAYVGRLKTLTIRARRGGPATLAEMWSLLGLAIFTQYAVGRPMSEVRCLWDWLARYAPPPLADGKVWGRRQVDFEHWAFLRNKAMTFAAMRVRPVALPSAYTRWSVTDAATSGAANVAAVVVTAKSVRVIVKKFVGASGIAVRELEAMLMVGEMNRKDEFPERERAEVIYTDNTVAESAMRRSDALWLDADRLRRLHSLHEADLIARSYVQVSRIDTARCIADPFTREGEDRDVSYVRRCDHPFRVGSLCACDVQWLETLTSLKDTFVAWRASPPDIPALPLAPVRSAWRASTPPAPLDATMLSL